LDDSTTTSGTEGEKVMVLDFY